MLITTQFPIQVLELSPIRPSTKQAQEDEELDIITSNDFDISTQDFESAFVFNAFSPASGSNDLEAVKVKARIYDPAASPTSPRSSWSLESSSSFSRTSSVDMMSPVSGRSMTSSSRHSPASNVSSVDSDVGPVAKCAAPSTNELTGSTIPSALSRPLVLRGSRRNTVSTASKSSNDNGRQSSGANFVSTTPPSFSSSCQRYTSTPLLESRPHRRSIINSPWTCLEDAHHPLCTGGCDQGVFSSSDFPPESAQVSRSGSGSCAKCSTSTWAQFPPVPPRDPRRARRSSVERSRTGF